MCNGCVGQDISLGLVTKKGVSTFQRFDIWEVEKIEDFCHRELGNPKAQNHISCGEIVHGCVRGCKGKERTCGSIYV